MKDYTFDVKLAATIQIRARSEKKAREWLDEIVDCLEVCESSELSESGVQVLETSTSVDDVAGPELTEIDDKSVN